MKNNSIKLLIFLFISTLLVSCYEDEGNYKYSKINSVSVKGIEKEYTKFTSIDKLEIPIEVTSVDPSVEFEYLWSYYDAKESITISDKKDLTFPITMKQGKYTLLLTVTEKASGIKYYFSSALTVETQFTRGWYILKEDGSDTELDLRREDTSLDNILANYSAMGKLKGKPVSIGYFSGGKIFLQSENDAYSVLIEDMSLIANYKDMFFAEPTEIPTQIGFCQNVQVYNWIDENGVYKASTPKFGYPMSIDGDTKGYVPSGFTAKNMTDILYYDELNCRFFVEPMNGSFLYTFKDTDKAGNATTWLPRDLDATMLYMGTFGGPAGSEKGSGFAVLEKRSGEKERLIFTVDTNAANAKYNPITKGVIAPLGSDIYNAKVFANNRNFAVLYYDNKNKLGMYDISSDSQKDIYTFTEGEEITYIHNSIYYSDKMDKIVVATYKNGDYKLYLFDILAGAPTGEPVIYEGKGRVKEVIYTAAGISSFSAFFK